VYMRISVYMDTQIQGYLYTSIHGYMNMRIPVMHYLCVKCGEPSMKVIWQAKMIMV
jgi:hypothetical protein